jgi:hypothetical protein
MNPRRMELLLGIFSLLAEDYAVLKGLVMPGFMPGIHDLG